MKKKCRWLAAMLAVVIMMCQIGTSTPVTAFAAVGNKAIEEFEDKEPEVTTPGWYQKGEDWYYNDSNGNKVFGWRMIDNLWYYFAEDNSEKPGAMLKDCRQNINGNTYFFAKSGRMETGWVEREEGWYYTDASGAMLTGWQLIVRHWYYLDGNNAKNPGLMIKNCKRSIGNKTYFFNESGQMQSGWVERKEGWYYTDASGKMLTGWQFVDGWWYYLDGNNAKYPGLMLRNCKKSIGDKMYFFSKSGVMQIGWAEQNEGWYYTDAAGLMLTGWQQVGAYWYYLDGNNVTYPGLMVSNCKKVIYGNTYRFGAGGEMITGWHRENGAWYYLDSSGLSASGWRCVDGYWYYLNPERGNKMESGGWKIIDGNWYYLYTNGAMATEWIKLGEYWYYLGADGAMRHGWQKLGYAWYYLYWANDPHGGPEGAMAKSTTIDGYELLSNGVMKETYIEVNLTTQHMWVIQNGGIAMECDVVTGLPRNDRITPAGEFKILEKKRNKILTGNIDPSTGQPEYRTPVDYWMRVTWSGIGFHDATWQPRFGGDWYKTHGSHGCINMPYWAAKQLYSLISVGTRVSIHY